VNLSGRISKGYLGKAIPKENQRNTAKECQSNAWAKPKKYLKKG